MEGKLAKDEFPRTFIGLTLISQSLNCISSSNNIRLCYWILEDDEEEEEEEDPEMEEEMEEENPKMEEEMEEENDDDDDAEEAEADTVGTITRVPYFVRPFSGYLSMWEKWSSRQVFYPWPILGRDVNAHNR
ncbi:hypothetical protein Tco_0631475 [Tanacetum coccineum]